MIKQLELFGEKCVCSLCHQEDIVEKYNPHGLEIHLCSECFGELQKEVATLEFTNREIFLFIFQKFGITPMKGSDQ